MFLNKDFLNQMEMPLPSQNKQIKEEMGEEENETGDANDKESESEDLDEQLKRLTKEIKVHVKARKMNFLNYYNKCRQNKLSNPFTQADKRKVSMLTTPVFINQKPKESMVYSPTQTRRALKWTETLKEKVFKKRTR